MGNYTFRGFLVLSLFCLAGLPEARAQNTDASQEIPRITVHERPNCNCCSRWVEHLKKNGFEVDASHSDSLSNVKDEAGIPDSLRSCHTAFVDDYVIEGHVPAKVIKRMLREQPDVMGLAVPGMPIGSPGMEMEGREPESYEIITFTKDTTRVYTRR